MGKLKELVETADKRIVTGVGVVFVAAFALVNYTGVRSAARGCVEAGLAAPVGMTLSGGPVVGTDTIVDVATARVCPFGRPSGAELAMSYGATLPTMVVSAIALGLLCFFLWGAVRPGLHSPVTPGRLRTLGWFVLVAGPVATAVELYFKYELAGALLRNTAEYRDKPPNFNGEYSAWLQELQMTFPWWYVFAGVSALIVAKLLRIEVRMAEDLAGTV